MKLTRILHHLKFWLKKIVFLDHCYSKGLLKFVSQFIKIKVVWVMAHAHGHKIVTMISVQ